MFEKVQSEYCKPKESAQDNKSMSKNWKILATKCKTISQQKKTAYIHPVTQMKFSSNTLSKGQKAKLFEFKNMNKYFTNREISFIVQHVNHEYDGLATANHTFKDILKSKGGPQVSESGQHPLPKHLMNGNNIDDIKSVTLEKLTESRNLKTAIQNGFKSLSDKNQEKESDDLSDAMNMQKPF